MTDRPQGVILRECLFRLFRLENEELNAEQLSELEVVIDTLLTEGATITLSILDVLLMQARLTHLPAPAQEPVAESESSAPAEEPQRSAPDQEDGHGEPWRFDPLSDSTYARPGAVLWRHDGHKVATFPWREEARRAQVCVNACDGLPTSTLERAIPLAVKALKEADDFFRGASVAVMPGWSHVPRRIAAALRLLGYDRAAPADDPPAPDSVEAVAAAQIKELNPERQTVSATTPRGTVMVGEVASATEPPAPRAGQSVVGRNWLLEAAGLGVDLSDLGNLYSHAMDCLFMTENGEIAAAQRPYAHGEAQLCTCSLAYRQKVAHDRLAVAERSSVRHRSPLADQ